MKLKKFCKEHLDSLLILFILLTVYAVEAAVRPLAAPGEYLFVYQLHRLIPDYPEPRLLLRLPSILLTFAGAGTVWLLGGVWKLKHPGRAAAFYLLFPPVFYIGTSATLMPLLSTGVLLALYGLLKYVHTRAAKERFFTLLGVIPVIIVTAFYIDSDFCNIRDLWGIVAVVTALILVQWFNYLERDKERAGRCLDRFARISSIILLILAVMVMIPVLLRHFKVDFPPDFAIYGRGERIIRPLLMLLLPLLWFNLARGAKKNGKKLILIGGAVAFLLFALPITLPWRVQKNIYWHYMFENIAKELPAGNTVCLAEEKDVPFFREFFKFPTTVIGENSGEIKPDELDKYVEKMLAQNNVLIVCSNDKLETSCPLYTGKRYRAGEFRLFYYFKNGVAGK